MQYKIKYSALRCRTHAGTIDLPVFPHTICSWSHSTVYTFRNRLTSRCHRRRISQCITCIILNARHQHNQYPWIVCAAVCTTLTFGFRRSFSRVVVMWRRNSREDSVHGRTRLTVFSDEPSLAHFAANPHWGGSGTTAAAPTSLSKPASHTLDLCRVSSARQVPRRPSVMVSFSHIGFSVCPFGGVTNTDCEAV